MKQLWKTGDDMPAGRYVYVRNAGGGRCGDLHLGYYALRDPQGSERRFPRCPEGHEDHAAEWTVLPGPMQPANKRDGFPVSR